MKAQEMVQILDKGLHLFSLIDACKMLDFETWELNDLKIFQNFFVKIVE